MFKDTILQHCYLIECSILRHDSKISPTDVMDTSYDVHRALTATPEEPATHWYIVLPKKTDCATAPSLRDLIEGRGESML
ncbi:hypothetical protein Y032_0116g623 [Ancylostoma ceylanicum]|uniref:Uncharacterized protein n=1 Tax=Ancylostoma ceylanicum TaxID=53326 RepID=A0A016TCQ2_9BILA|nr:hypothetical protein Y032_0116g623 [Ancylostoma ceylanicum]